MRRPRNTSVNTEIESFDARLEYYFGRDQFVTVGAFHKVLDNPIEEFILATGDTLGTSFINAPEATLTGAEIEFEKVFDFSGRTLPHAEPGVGTRLETITKRPCARSSSRISSLAAARNTLSSACLRAWRNAGEPLRLQPQAT